MSIIFKKKFSMITLLAQVFLSRLGGMTYATFKRMRNRVRADVGGNRK